MNIGNISKPLVMGILGPGLGGPVGAIMSPLAGPQMQQLAQMLQQLQGAFGKAGGAVASQAAQRPQPFSSVNININITLNPQGALQAPSKGPLQSFGHAPIIGNDSQWGAFANAANSRITGSDKSFNFSGTNPWVGGGDKNEMAAVGWAMQKNDKVRFDSDRKQFYVTNADGSTRDVASLDDVKAEIARNGGASPSNGKAFNAVGSFLENRVNNPSSQPAAQRSASNANPFQELLQMIEKLVQALQGGQVGGASSVSNGGGVSGASGADGAGGAGGAAGAEGAASSPSVASSGGGIDSMIDSAGSKIDSMMGQAEKLMASDKMADQLKGQRMMQQAMRMFEMISKMLEQRSQMQAKAIQAIK